MEILVVFAVILVVGITIAWVVRSRRRRRAACESEVERALPGLRRAMVDLYRGEYIAQSELFAWMSRNADAIRVAKALRPEFCLAGEELETVRTLCDELKDPEQTVRAINDGFVKARLFADKAAFDQVERYPLTESQRRAIVTAEDTTLVIAGAGTGKTSTIVGKVDYLIRRRLAAPSEILVLAFAKKASEELKDRLQQFGEAGAVSISTFHSLGYQIVSQVDGKKPALSPLAEDERQLQRFLRDQGSDVLDSSDGQEMMSHWFGNYLDEIEPVDPETTPDELIRREQAKGLRALDGTKLKSRQEVKIANWLTLNGIKWDYERPYPIETATPWRRQYKPDFYLPEYDIYIEHFGIDENGSTAPHVDQRRYVQAMEWKRALHLENKTRLVQTYSYFEKNGGIIAHLSRLLMEQGVRPRPLTKDEIDRITHEGNRTFSDFVRLLAQFLAVFKSSGGNLDLAVRRASSNRDIAFLGLFKVIFSRYEAHLAKSGAIDFNDMIINARKYVESSQFRSSYTYIVIDEFQDISESRLGLIQAMRAQVPHSRLFAVGDDWQSIYRFTGSDVNIIAQLPTHVGSTERVDLDTAFRFRQELLDASAAFITKNPTQLEKNIRAYEGPANELPISLMLGPRVSDSSLEGQIVRCLEDIQLRKSDDRSTSVFLLGRYNFSAPTNLDSLKSQWMLRGIAIEFYTVHSSKGKEADYVIVLGLEAGEYGFPSNVADDPVMNMILSEPENYAYAEERRLFYVAITRARMRTYLLAPEDTASPFVIDDLMQPPLVQFVETIGEISQRVLCPKCQGQTIRRTEGQFGAFWACSHYPICLGRLDTCPSCNSGGLAPTSENGLTVLQCTVCKQRPEMCPRCRTGHIQKRIGKYGVFLGCSNWNGGAGCTFTANREG